MTDIVIKELKQQLAEEHEAHLIADEQWIARHEVALEAAHYEAVKVVALKRELAAETNNKQEFERDWLTCCDKLNDERRIHLELEETLVKKLEVAQAREKVLRDAVADLLYYMRSNDTKDEEDAAVKTREILYQPTDDTALKAALAAEREKHCPLYDAADIATKAMRKAWQLGQTYWQQADSESCKREEMSKQSQMTTWFAAFDECARICQEAADECARSADACSTLDTRLECLTEQAAFLSAVKRIMQAKYR